MSSQTLHPIATPYWQSSNTSRILKLVRYYAVIIARCGKLCMQTWWKLVLATLTIYQPLPMLISSMQVQLHCRLDFFSYRNLFQNEISDDFSSKSFLKLLIHSNAHIHNYRSRKKDEFWSLKSDSDCRQAQFYWNHMGS